MQPDLAAAQVLAVGFVKASFSRPYLQSLCLRNQCLPNQHLCNQVLRNRCLRGHGAFGAFGARDLDFDRQLPTVLGHSIGL